MAMLVVTEGALPVLVAILPISMVEVPISILNVGRICCYLKQETGEQKLKERLLGDGHVLMS
jgi:hypothetical protein